MKVFRTLRCSHLGTPILFLVFGFCQGCTSVAPWERGTLAKEQMSITPDPNLTRLRDHIFSSKEASQGGHGGTGGGCGCN
ncbi:DUF4266 domain-containing protein [Methylocaldum szegediense]|uniref:DUF4266 domain-containing protein n=1 Tax=Methylocaldum szegediense TaxID=73780 RepID=UPI00295E8990|nr:DUF4266 domain-containing protein [Methylocaldum szegediense]